MGKKTDKEIVPVSMEKYIRFVDAESRLLVLSEKFNSIDSLEGSEFKAIKDFLAEHFQKGAN